MGISAADFAAAMRKDPQEALLQFLGTLEQLDEKTRSEALFRIFGQGMSDDVALLVGQLQNYKPLLGEVADKTKYLGSMSREFEARAKTTASQINLMTNSIKLAAINLGTIFLPIIADVAKGVAGTSKAIAELVQEYPALAGLATVLASAAVAASGMKVAFLAARLAGVGSMAQLSAAAKLLTTDMTRANMSIGLMGKTIGVVSAGFAGWELGTWARKNSKTVSAAGSYMAEAFALVENQLHRTSRSSKDIHADFKALRGSFKTNAEAIAEDQKKLVDGQQQIAKTIDETKKSVDDFAKKNVELGGTDETKQKIEALRAELDSLSKEAPAASAEGLAEQQKRIDELKKSLADLSAWQKTALDSGNSTASTMLAKLKDVKGGAEAITNTLKSGIESVKSKDLPALANGLKDAIKAGGDGAEQQMAGLQKRMEILRGAISNSNSGIADDLKQRLQDAKAEYDKLLAAQQIEIGKATAANEQIAKTALDRLGLDGEKMLGLVSDASRDATGAFEAVAISIDKMGFSAAQQGEVIKESLSKALESAKSQSDVDALNEKIKQLGDNGQLSGKQMQNALDETKRKSRELADELTGADEAFVQLGIKSQKTQQQELEKTRQAYERIRQQVAAGQATAEDENAAFLAYSQAVVQSGENATTAQGKQQANQQRELLRTQADVKGLRNEYERLNGVVGGGGGGDDNNNEGLRRLSNGVHEVKNEAEGAKEAAEKMSNGFGEFSGRVGNDLRKNVEKSAEKTKQAVRMVTKAVGSATEELGKLSQNALQSFAEANPDFGKWMGVSEKMTELEALQGQIKGTTDEIRSMQDSLARYGEAGQSFATRIKNQTIQVLEQKMALVQTVKALKDMPPELGRAAINADELKQRFNLLDESDLSQLDSAISSVNSRLDQTNSKAQSATDRLNSMADASMQASRSETERLMRERNAKLKEINSLEKDDKGDAAAARRARGAVQREYESQLRDVRQKETDRKKQDENKTVNLKLEIPGMGKQKDMVVAEKSVPAIEDYAQGLANHLADLYRRGAGR